MKRINYIICSVPRSGSYLLGDYLRKLGLGNPDEFLNPDIYNAKQRKNEKLKYFFNRIFEKGCENNGCGIKTHLRHMEWFLDGINKKNKKNIKKEDFFKALPELKYIFIDRKNRLRQAISYLKGLQAKAWKKQDVDPSQKFIFKFREIKRFIRELEKESLDWKEFFKKNNIRPFVIYYEDLVKNKKKVIFSLLRYLNSDVKNVKIRTDMQKQADFQTEIWVLRYKFKILKKRIRKRLRL